MKRLSLLRHAKSSWDDPVRIDFDRPLNDRGRRAARTMGEWMAGQSFIFDRIWASSAVRVRETLAFVAQGYGKAPARRQPAPQFDRRLYMAPAPSLLELVQQCSDDVGHLLLVGHNPGLEDLLQLATRGRDSPLRREARIKYPTATFAMLHFDIRNWTEAGEGCASLMRFMRPRDLDPALGPES